MKEYLSISETDALVEVESPDISPRAAFGKNVHIFAKKITVRPGAVVGSNTRIKGG